MEGQGGRGCWHGLVGVCTTLQLFIDDLRGDMREIFTQKGGTSSQKIRRVYKRGIKGDEHKKLHKKGAGRGCTISSIPTEKKELKAY